MSPLLFEQIAKLTLDILDLSVEVRCVQVDDGSAGAGEALVRLEPSERFARVSSAIAARDIDSLLIEHVGLLRELLDRNEGCLPSVA